MGIETYSRKRGEEAIRIENLPHLFSLKWLSNEIDLHKKYPNLEYFPNQQIRMPELMIFPIMDTENGRDPNKAYMTGSMFDQSPFRKRIHPIYSIPNLDVVIEKAGLGQVSKDKPSSYSNMLDDLEVKDLYDALKDRQDTNLSDFLKYCMKTRPGCQGKVF